MGFFDDQFGGFFDFNGDGKTTGDEEWLGMMIINECMKEEKNQSDPTSTLDGVFESENDEEDSEWRIFCEDGAEYGLDPYDFDSEEEYEEALANAKVAWRESCDDGLEFGVDPGDYDTEDEYYEALEEAKSSWKEICEEGSVYGLDPEDYDSIEDYEEALEEAKEAAENNGCVTPFNITFIADITDTGDRSIINPSDYSNLRQYDAAHRLFDLKQGTAYIPTWSDKKKEIEKCNFILNSETIAANYLTVYDGFLFTQAVKENFDLPIYVEDEDETVKIHFDDFFLELAEENPALALEVWIWCLKVFDPYKEYMDNDWTLYNGILSNINEYPEAFIDAAINALGSDFAFCDAVITKNSHYPYGTARLVARALEVNLVKEAQIIFTATAMNTKAKCRDIESLIHSVISGCSSWEELETMERFQSGILPIIRKMNNKRIQRLLPGFIADVDQYIRSVESSVEKYRYSRRFAWRKFCADGSEYGVDPLDFETEEEYTAALRAKRKAERETNTQRPQYTDPLAETDKTVYEFCSVLFPATNQSYIYLTGGLDVRIGDEVVVPVGNAGKEVVATVVSTSQHLRISAPFPVDKAKKILKVIPAEKNSQGR